MVALMCWTLAAGWVPPMRTHSVSIAAAAAALGATQLKQPRGATPRWQRARGGKIAAPCRSPVAWHRRRGTISEAPSSGRGGGADLNGYCDRAFRDCGCGDHDGMGMAGGGGPNAAVPAGARREALLRLLHPVSGDAEPAWAR